MTAALWQGWGHTRLELASESMGGTTTLIVRGELDLAAAALAEVTP